MDLGLVRPEGQLAPRTVLRHDRLLFARQRHFLPLRRTFHRFLPIRASNDDETSHRDPDLVNTAFTRKDAVPLLEKVNVAVRREKPHCPLTAGTIVVLHEPPFSLQGVVPWESDCNGMTRPRASHRLHGKPVRRASTAVLYNQILKELANSL